MRRLLTAALATLAVVSSSWIVPAPARADAYDPIVINEGQTYRKSYPALGAADPSGSFTAPADCPGAPGHICDLIPIHIGEPADPNDYVIRIRVTFEADKLANGVESSDDLDVYLWDDPPADHDKDKEGGDEDPDEIMHSAGTSSTESVGIDSLPSRKYSLLIYHSLGRNTGYNVEVRYFPGGGVRPDESLEPEFIADLPSGHGPSGSVATPSRTSPFASVPNPAGAVGVDLAVDTGGNAFLDPNLPGVGGPSSLDNANRLGSIFGRRPTATGPPKPVRDLTVALWMTITPALVLAAGAFLFMRRRPAALLIH
jgi:hypothetical protein